MANGRRRDRGHDEVVPEHEIHERERREAEQRSAPGSTVIYGAILREGEEELTRSTPALFWSGLAAGLAMGFSMIAEALLATYLPDAPWRPVVAKLGYSAGFLIVVLGRQQLFTENTLTPILPLLRRRPHATAGNVARLWAVVLAANLLGGLAVALVAAHTSAFDPPVREAFRAIGARAMQLDFGTAVLRGVFAGWLIALMVWLLPFAESARVGVIVFVTYLVGLANFTHVIAGSIEVFTFAALGGAAWSRVLGGYVVPTLLGNVLGGVTLVTLLNHGQVTAGGDGTRAGRERLPRALPEGA